MKPLPFHFPEDAMICPADPRLAVWRGDITRLKIDAIVNAANTGLLGGGGVDGAIHRAAGPELDRACRAIRESRGGCPTGQAVITPGFQLPASWIIHTVGPVWSGRRDPLGDSLDAPLLAACYSHSLKLAASEGLSSLAFPNISTGVYGYPKAEAAHVAVSTVRSLLGFWDRSSDPGTGDEPPSGQLRILFVCFDEENYRLYRDVLGV
jgi:O-acetyl-ADP-ribose deacetylase (regulator of RNase III)